MKILSSLTELLKKKSDAELFLLDLWGVIHDGVDPYPGAKEAVHYLRAQGKKIAFISNAPRRAFIAAKKLKQMDILEGRDYDLLMTSGEVTYHWLSSHKAWLHTNRYFYIGPERDAGLLENSPYVRTNTPKEADFAIVTGFKEDDSTLDEVRDALAGCKAATLPMICANPDKEIVRQDGVHALCAGVIAEAYEKMGGQVTYFGKPHSEIYQFIFEKLQVNPNQAIAVGDNLETDIRGANTLGIYSVIITGGVLSHIFSLAPGQLPEKSALAALCKKHRVKPDAVMASFIA